MTTRSQPEVLCAREMKKADPAGSVHLIDIPLITRQIGIVDLVQTPLAQDHIPRLCVMVYAIARAARRTYTAVK